MRCSRCDAFLSAGQAVCDRCFSPVEEERPRPPPVQAPAAEVPAVEGNAALALEPAAVLEHPCPRHADMPVAGTCKRCGSFVCARCAPALVEGGEVRCEACRPRESAAAGEGIRGWLALPAIHLVLTLVSSFVYLMMVGMRLAAADGGGPQADLVWTASLAHVALFGFTLYVALLFFRRKREARGMMVSWYVVQLLLAAFLVLVGAGSSAVRNVLAACIWIPYFLASKQVRRTFTR